ncbi:ChbG/HpnK family deacetylase [Candidatus Poriferisocius sp.]|uniref:ChbG/HpnK family deacetylase n=1 Tax=Candidatus Poriferisocius sp. TaxID=3101276 RepID=UPI003B027449
MVQLVIHADDVGMCHGANRAFAELSHFGTITSGSVMVPCPWFTEIAETAATDDALDCGIHLTLNAEMDHYRWGPVSSAGPSSGLVDEHGYLWRDVASVRRNAHPDAVEQEWRAQIDRALAAGINVTHLVFCAFHPNAPGGAEIEVIEPENFHVRTDEYELFGTADWREWLTSQPYELVSMGDLAQP